MTLRLRGTGEGTIQVHIGDAGAAELAVHPQESWTDHTVSVSGTGKQCLGFDYRGTGEVEFLEFRFEKE